MWYIGADMTVSHVVHRGRYVCETMWYFGGRYDSKSCLWSQIRFSMPYYLIPHARSSVLMGFKYRWLPNQYTNDKTNMFYHKWQNQQVLSQMTKPTCLITNDKTNISYHKWQNQHVSYHRMFLFCACQHLFFIVS